jgi:hypothetical protein
MVPVPFQLSTVPFLKKKTLKTLVKLSLFFLGEAVPAAGLARPSKPLACGHGTGLQQGLLEVSHCLFF